MLGAEAPMLMDAQVRLLRRKMMEGKTQETAAAAADVSVRSARTWQTGALPSETKEERSWRTRKDPFEAAWSSTVIPLLTADKAGILQATTILAALNEERDDDDKYGEGQLRTLQRRIRDWRALHGPEQEVFFEQEHPPGREGALDFTNCNELGVTIQGEAFPHLQGLTQGLLREHREFTRLGDQAVRVGRRPRNPDRRAVLESDGDALVAIYHDVEFTPAQWMCMARDPHAFQRASENVLSL